MLIILYKHKATAGLEIETIFGQKEAHWNYPETFFKLVTAKLASEGKGLHFDDARFCWSKERETPELWTLKYLVTLRPVPVDPFSSHLLMPSKIGSVKVLRRWFAELQGSGTKRVKDRNRSTTPPDPFDSHLSIIHAAGRGLSKIDARAGRRIIFCLIQPPFREWRGEIGSSERKWLVNAHVTSCGSPRVVGDFWTM
jgi:hypothetical protein